MNYNQYTKAFHAMCIGFGLVLMILWLGHADYEHEIDELAEACEMHKIWLDGAFARVPVEQRNGWSITIKQFNDKCKEFMGMQHP